MSPPTTLAKVRATLKRFVPPISGWLADTSQLGKERDSIGLALAMANDPVELAFAEIFPDTMQYLADRWEKVTRVPSRPNDDISLRRARVLAVLRRVNGPQLARLAASLASVLAVDAGSIVFLETLRSQIEAGLTLTTGVMSTALPATFNLGKPFPGKIDDTGVRVYLALTTLGSPSATLTHPDGTAWTFTPTGTTGWYSTRSVFLGKGAAGMWRLAVSGAATCTEARLLVSNDVDAAQIYNFYIVRDPALAGTADLDEAQRQLSRYALGHMKAKVAERTACIVDDVHSRVDRDPIGV